MSGSNRLAAVVGLVAIILVIGAFVLLRDAETSELARGADVAVSCGATQRAVVRQTVASGTPHVDIQCVDGPAAQAASYVVDEHGRVTSTSQTGQSANAPVLHAPVVAAPAPYVPVEPAPVAYAPVAAPQQAVMVPAVYHQPAPQAPVAQRVSAGPARSSAPSREAQSKSSWKKRALVIGGSAGAGAGVGALVGGKKGALIGAAIGGGGAALFDALDDK